MDTPTGMNITREPAVQTPEISHVMGDADLEMPRRMTIIALYNAWLANAGAILSGDVAQSLARMESDAHAHIAAQCATIGILPSFASRRFKNDYSIICHNLISCLTPAPGDSTSYVYKMLMTDPIFAIGIHARSGTDLSPARSQKIMAEIERRRNQGYEEKTSSAYTCRKCGGKKTKFQKNQTRASDEDNTMSLTCVICNNRWTL